MQKTLLSTKLTIPPTRQELVLRPALISMLAKAKGHRLTLVSAPPGYGKTTLVSSWLGSSDLSFTWLSLDEDDNDPIRFLEYFLTALHHVVPAIRPDFLDQLHGSLPDSFEMIKALLINEAASAGDFYLVLDDFHTLHNRSIIDMLDKLVEHLPAAMHIMLISRTDPQLPLSRLRARGQLMEIRAEQLRFSVDEITQFFDEFMGLKLSTPDVSAIETRTEGWIAGLQLAGLAMQSALVPSQGDSMRAMKDPHSFIKAFTGSHIYIMDYLTEEVLSHQPEIVRSFLLKTAILDRLCGPICDALVGTNPAEPFDSQTMLEAIEHNHLFVISLDTERRWYRYHHLFKEVLGRRLEILYPEQIAGLHRGASEWFEQHGFIHEAIQHAMNAGESDRTVCLVEQHGCDLLMGGELVTLANWLAAVEPYIKTRPWLMMQKAWVLSLSGQPDQAKLVIDTGEELLSGLELTDEVRTLRGSFAAARAHWANTQGKTDLAVKYAQLAIDILGVNDDFSCSLRGVATSLLGDASWVQGNLDEARQAYEAAVRIGQIAGNPHMTMMASINLADIHFEQGELHQAATIYSDILRMTEQVDGANSAYSQNIHFGLSRVYYAWNRLDEAAISCEKGRRLSQQWGNVNLQAAFLALTARLEHTRGNLVTAEEAITDAEELVKAGCLSPYWSMWIKITLANSCLDQGQIEKALLFILDTGVLPESFTLDPVSSNGLSLEAPISYHLEPAYIALSRIFLALGKSDAVLAISEHVYKGAKAGNWRKAMLELHVLQALALQSNKETGEALMALEKAIILARPEHEMRVFLDEGERMAKLLYQAKAHRVGGEFGAELLSCFDHPVGIEPSPARSTQNLLIEPLSGRELEVLQYIAEGYSNQEIADQFVLSLKTVKRHISNIYAKLEAKNRTQAVALARALKLIE